MSVDNYFLASFHDVVVQSPQLVFDNLYHFIRAGIPNDGDYFLLYFT